MPEAFHAFAKLQLFIDLLNADSLMYESNFSRSVLLPIMKTIYITVHLYTENRIAQRAYLKSNRFSGVGPSATYGGITLTRPKPRLSL